MVALAWLLTVLLSCFLGAGMFSACADKEMTKTSKFIACAISLCLIALTCRCSVNSTIICNNNRVLHPIVLSKLAELKPNEIVKIYKEGAQIPFLNEDFSFEYDGLGEIYNNHYYYFNVTGNNGDSYRLYYMECNANSMPTQKEFKTLLQFNSNARVSDWDDVATSDRFKTKSPVIPSQVLLHIIRENAQLENNDSDNLLASNNEVTDDKDTNTKDVIIDGDVSPQKVVYFVIFDTYGTFYIVGCVPL